MADFCPNCRAEIPRATARFCDKCGVRLAVAVKDEAAIANNKNNEEETTVYLSETTDQEGATRSLPQPIPDDEEVNSSIEAIEDGETTRLPPPLYGSNRRQTDETPEDGETTRLPSDLSETDRRQTDEATEDGETTYLSSDLYESDPRQTGEVTEDEDTAHLQPGETEHDLAERNATVELGKSKTALPQGIDITGTLIYQRYQVLKTLGKGGFGAVYLAQDIKLKRLCVVKQMLPKSKSPKKIKLDQANFEREAELLVQLNHPGHPNIPEIYDHFFDHKGNYLVMKYIEGRSLQQILEEDEMGLSAEDVVRYAVHLCSALHYMHTYFDEPVMHRDIKPANILLGDDGRIWLVDFGLAKAKPADDTDDARVTQASGSWGYTPLEQWFGEAVPASDIYALGATLHYLLTGLNPLEAFAGDFNVLKLQQMHGQFIPIRKVNPDLPEPLEGIVASAVGADPDQRPTALQMEQQFKTLISGAKDMPLFTFKNGQAATTTGQLVDLCDAHKREAQGYLYRGDFERWFRLINRNDLADAASQAVKKGKNQRDGLEKFLKLVLPNLFWRRLGRATMYVARETARFALATIIVIAALAIISSFVVRLLIWQIIGNAGPENAPEVEIGQVNRYTEPELEAYVDKQVGAILDNIRIDISPPNRLDFSATWAGIFLLEIPFMVEAGADQNLQFQITEINGIPLYIITDNISQGINDGIDTAFDRSPVDVAGLEIQDTVALVEVKGNERWNPAPTPTGIPPTPTPTPVKSVLLAIFNEANQDILLEIDGERLVIPVNDTKAINLAPDTYSYVVRTADGQRLLGQGRKRWTQEVYELRIRFDDGQSVDVIEQN